MRTSIKTALVLPALVTTVAMLSPGAAIAHPGAGGVSDEGVITPLGATRASSTVSRPGTCLASSGTSSSSVEPTSRGQPRVGWPTSRPSATTPT